MNSECANFLAIENNTNNTRNNMKSLIKNKKKEVLVCGIIHVNITPN